MVADAPGTAACPYGWAVCGRNPAICKCTSAASPAQEATPPRCTCPDFQSFGSCRHAAEIVARVNREFTVQPEARAATEASYAHLNAAFRPAREASSAPGEPDWTAWKAHLVVCAACTAGYVCSRGDTILGGAEPADAPWLRLNARDSDGIMLLVWGDWAKKEGNEGASAFFNRVADRIALTAVPAPVASSAPDMASRFTDHA